MARYLFLILLFSAPVMAWNDEGHRTVALVAQRKLSPQARQWVSRVLAAHPHGVRSLSDAAGWPDRVRDMPDFHHQEWHYINYPIFLDIPERPVTVTGEALSAINSAVRVLKDPLASAPDRAVALAWLVHVVGDIHQPLHAANGYSAAFPEGDRGGGRLMVGMGQELIKLHAFWDAAGGLYWNGANRRRLDTIVAGLLVDYPVDERAAIRTPALWADESHKLGRDVAYAGVAPERPLSAEYIARARQVSQERMALAGYRLADLLERLARVRAHP